MHACRICCSLLRNFSKLVMERLMSVTPSSTVPESRFKDFLRLINSEAPAIMPLPAVDDS